MDCLACSDALAGAERVTIGQISRQLTDERPGFARVVHQAQERFMLALKQLSNGFILSLDFGRTSIEELVIISGYQAGDL